MGIMAAIDLRVTFTESSIDEDVFSESSVMFSQLFHGILIIGHYNAPSHKMNYFPQKPTVAHSIKENY